MRDYRQFTYKKPAKATRRLAGAIKARLQLLFPWLKDTPSVRLTRSGKIALLLVGTMILVGIGVGVRSCIRELASEGIGAADSPADSNSAMMDSGFDSLSAEEDTGSDTSVLIDTAPSAEESKDSPHIQSQRDTLLARRIDQLLRRNKPDHAFILMVDGATNEILAWGQRSDSAIRTEPTFLKRSTFPAASIIKIVTAAAAMESGRYKPSTDIPMIGRKHTLYNRQLKPEPNYNGPTITLSDAFAESANPAFALIGARIGNRNLSKTARDLGFQRHFPGGVPDQSFFLPPDTGYGLAEVASGFTRANTLSPLHAAALVRACMVSGPVSLPWSSNLASGFAPRTSTVLENSGLQASTRQGMRQLMVRTVTHGTGRKWMRRTVYSYNRDGLDIGGKTGSLDGSNPPGRYDWFVGYAQYKKDPGQFVILVVMQVHGKYRTLPSPAMAGQLINHWAKHNIVGE